VSVAFARIRTLVLRADEILLLCEPQPLDSSCPPFEESHLPKSEKAYTLSGDDDACVTVWGKDWIKPERLPRAFVDHAVTKTFEIERAYKPNRKGKMVVAYRYCYEKFQKIRDLSSQMGPRVTGRIENGSHYHEVLAHSYTRHLTNPLALRT
jgi:hypothetical protein